MTNTGPARPTDRDVARLGQRIDFRRERLSTIIERLRKRLPSLGGDEADQVFTANVLPQVRALNDDLVLYQGLACLELARLGAVNQSSC